MADAVGGGVPDRLRAAVARDNVVGSAEFDLLESGWSEAGVAGLVQAAVLHVAVGAPAPEPGLLAQVVSGATPSLDVVGDLAPDLVAVLVDIDADGAARLGDQLRAAVEAAVPARPVWVGVAIGQADDAPGAIHDRAIDALGQARQGAGGDVVVVGRT